MDTFEKLEYRIKAGIESAKIEKDSRLADRLELPLKGLDGEKIFLTGVGQLNSKAQELNKLYRKIPESEKMASVILMDAHSSATIEGAHTTVERMVECLQAPETKDEIMVANTYYACRFAYEYEIDENNIRELWDKVVEGVCENSDKAGNTYRNGMVYVGNATENIHTPASPDKIPMYMKNLFDFEHKCKLDPIIKSFVFHFYFVYIHPFCDGNGRTARTINSSQLFFSGFTKIKSIAMATAINRDLSAYYRNIKECEKAIGNSKKNKWLDLSPFVDYMLKIFEDSLTNALLANHMLSDKEKLVLERMNKKGTNAEITIKNAMQITKLSYSGARKLLLRLANDGYLVINKKGRTHIFILAPHI